MIDSIKKIASTDVLTIQKLVFLLDDFHYGAFLAHLEQTNATLPKKLVSTIRRALPTFDTHHDLCTKVYGDATEASKKKFNQLTSHTFRLTEFLALNYPSYLTCNISLLEADVNRGNTREAYLRAVFLQQIAERIDDFHTQMAALNFLSADAYLHSDSAEGMRYSNMAMEAMNRWVLYEQLNHKANQIAQTPPSEERKKKYDEWLAYFKQYHNHPSAAIRMYSLYSAVKLVFDFRKEYFHAEEEKAFVTALDREFQNHSYVVIPFMSNLKGNFGYIRLNTPATRLYSKEWDILYKNLEDYYAGVMFTSHYINHGLLHLMAIEASRIISLYHHHLHKSNFHQLLTTRDSDSIEKQIARCTEMLQLPIERKSNENYVIVLLMLRGAYYMLRGGKKNIKEGIDELEGLLTSFQQNSLRGVTDSIYMLLLTAYFSIADYEKCEASFKRYAKVRGKKNIYSGNDLKIHTYYYLAQYLRTNSKQYYDKLCKVVAEDKIEKSKASLVELMEHFGLKLPGYVRHTEEVDA